jgi:hypothetical protein
VPASIRPAAKEDSQQPMISGVCFVTAVLFERKMCFEGCTQFSCGAVDLG